MWWNQATLKREAAQVLAQKKVAFVSQGKAGTKACAAPPARGTGLCSSITYWKPCNWQLPPKQMADIYVVLPLCSLFSFRIGGYWALALIFSVQIKRQESCCAFEDLDCQFSYSL